MKRVLVTGGNGFIGRHAVQALRAEGLEVVVSGRTIGVENGLLAVNGDLLDPDFRKRLIGEARPDILLHLAWQTKHGHFWTAPDNPDWLEAGKDLLDRFLDAGGYRAVLAGSCAEYDWTALSDTPVGEDAPCSPHTLYGQCKLALYRHAEERIGRGASIAWGRLFFLMGPDEAPARFVPSIVTSLLKGEVAKMSAGTQIRDFMHSADAGRAFAALSLGAAIGAVNVASGEAVTLLEVAREAERLVGRGTLDPGAYPPRSDDPPYLVADVSRLKDEIGFIPDFNWRSALQDCVNWWRSRICAQ